MAHGGAREGKWSGNWRMEWVASTLHTTSEHGVSSITTITTADVHTSAASSRLNWRPRRFKWTRPFRRKTKSGFCTCAITFQTQSTTLRTTQRRIPSRHKSSPLSSFTKGAGCSTPHTIKTKVGPLSKHLCVKKSRGRGGKSGFFPELGAGCCN
jgi:hypothetical protein